MYAIRYEIQDFSKLPFYVKEGVIIKITGEEGDTLSDYYVKFSGNLVYGMKLLHLIPLLV